MEELLQILNKLEGNTNAILEENKRLEDKIKVLKGEIEEKPIIPIDPEKPEIEVPEDPITDINCGLLGKLEDLVFVTENYATCSINEGQLTIDGNSRYANAYIIYEEKEEDCIPNVIGKYTLHIEGKIIKGCSNAYLNTTSTSLKGESFSYDYQLTSSWQRKLRITIFLNGAKGENSKMVITSLKLAKAE